MADNEAEKAQAIPAVFVNRFYVTAGPDVVRITCGEAVIGTIGTPRQALVMRRADALALGELLLRLAKPGEPLA